MGITVNPHHPPKRNAHAKNKQNPQPRDINIRSGNLRGSVEGYVVETSKCKKLSCGVLYIQGFRNTYVHIYIEYLSYFGV